MSSPNKCQGMYISLGQLTSKVPRLCYSTSDFYSSCGVLQLLSYHNASTTSKPITSELNKQIADVFGLADLENFAWHILSLYLHCRDREKCDVTLPGSGNNDGDGNENGKYQ